MIKTWVNKALILAYITLFCFLGISARVSAERLFILDNLLENGNFQGNTNNWIKYEFNAINYENGFVYGTNTGRYPQLSNATTIIQDHIYYYNVSFHNVDIPQTYFNNIVISLYKTGESQYIYSNYVYTNNIVVAKGLVTANNSYTSFNFYYALKQVVTGYNVGFGNTIFIDLTQLFGYGYEPSLQDFELYYLPDLDYFDTYNSFEPDMTNTISDLNYTNIQENLTGIDYTKSIIDNDGKNIDLDLSLYFYDTVVNGTTISGIYTALDYVSSNKPIMYYNGVEYELSWVFSDYSQRVIILDLTDEEEIILKKILFNRNIDRDQEYFNLKVETGFLSYAKMWFTIGSKFDLLVDVKSFLLSRETITDNEFNIINEMYIKTYDTDDNLLLPSLKMTIADLFRTVYVDNFGSQYTNISKFNFEFLLVSPDTTDDYEFENHYFYEIGIFSSDKVLHPSFIESDIDSLWEYKTCDWYQIGCHLSNFANDVLTTTYNRMNIDAIIAFFDGIIDDVTQVVDTVPSGVKTVFAVLFTGLGVALIIVIIEKMNR